MELHSSQQKLIFLQLLPKLQPRRESKSIEYKTLTKTSFNVNFFKKNFSRLVDGSIPGRVRELLPVFDTHGFTKIPPPIHKTIKPRP